MNLNPAIPRIGEYGYHVAVDWRVLAFTALVALLTGIVFGLMPALESARSDLNTGLRDAHSGAGFHRTSFAHSFGRKVERIAAAFLDCNLGLADLSEARLAGARLPRSRLREADLSNTDLEGADLTGADLFQAIVDGAKLAGADLRGAEVSGLDLRRLATYRDLKITADQQFRLLDAMGIDVQVE